MTQQQINKLEMLQATNEYLDGQSDSWINIPILSNYKNELSQRITAIRGAAQDQDAARVFLGGSLRQLKKHIADKMDMLDDVLEAYADDIENEELRIQAANSATDYFRLPNEEFETKTKNMISLLEEHVTAMVDYGLTPAQIDDAKLSFDNYQSQRGKPRSYQIASRVATQNIDELFDESNRYVVKIDKVMKRFKRSNPSFFNGYLAARLIINN